MAVKFTNNAKTTLASGINSSVTTATVTDGSVFPTLDAGEHFYCTFDDGTNNEIVKVTARSSNTLTIIRGVDSTTARSFSSGDAAELRATSALLTDIQENIAAKSANQTVFSATTASSATDYDVGQDPGVEANASVFLDGVYQHHDTFSFSGSTLTFDTAPIDGTALEVIIDNLVNLQSSNLTVDTFTAADVGGNPQVDFTLSDAPAAETNLIVFVDGVFQANDTYTISSTTLSMTDGVTADRVVTVYVMNPVNIGTPSDGTITSSKLSGDITMPGDLTVTGDVAFDSPTFVVDNANSRVGIGTASPSTLLDIVGDVKMSANLTVDTSTLVVDATNNRVGIGTTSVGTKLNIRSDASDDGILLEKSDGTDIARLFHDGTSTNARFDMFSGGSATVQIKASGDTHFSGGNVGIGTSNPATQFHLVNADDAVARIESSGSESGDDARLEIKTTNGTFTIQNDRSLGTSGALTFAGNTSNNIVIDHNSGNVGIGTTSPTSQLDVRGVFHVGASANTTPVIGRSLAPSGSQGLFLTAGLVGGESTTTPTFADNSSSGASIYLGGNAVDQYGGSVALKAYGAGADGNLIVFENRSGTNTFKETMRIDSSGYITTPAQPYIRCAGNFAGMAANQGTTADFSNWSDQVQRGITRSGAVFTVPKAGEYLITYSFYNWINNSGPGITHAIVLKKNNSTVQETVAEYDFENDAYSYYDNQLQNSFILNMSAGDTFRFSTNADIYGGGVHTNMSAYLLG